MSTSAPLVHQQLSNVRSPTTSFSSRGHLIHIINAGRKSKRLQVKGNKPPARLQQLVILNNLAPAGPPSAISSSCGEGSSPAFTDHNIVSSEKELHLIDSATIISADAGADLHPALQAAVQVLHDIVQEIYLSFRFVSYDITASVLPSMLFTLATHVKGENFFAEAMAPLWKSLACTFAWIWLYVYVLTLANQINGVEEDVINKPTRPIPSGEVKEEGAYYRLVWVCGLFVMLGMQLRIGFVSAMWVAACLMLNFWKPALTYLHWLMKPIVMMIGIVVMCMGSACVASPATMYHRPTLTYIGTVSVAIGAFTANLQDLRDVEGDKKGSKLGGRTTLPILLGDMRARFLCSFLLMCAWGTCHTTLVTLSHRTYNLATSAFILAYCMLLCFRTLVMRSPAQDHQTYLLQVYLYSFLLFAYSWVV